MTFILFSLKHGDPFGDALFWGPDRCGYTTDIDAAGRYDLDEAVEIIGDGETTAAIPTGQLDFFRISPRRIDLKEPENKKRMDDLVSRSAETLTALVDHLKKINSES